MIDKNLFLEILFGLALFYVAIGLWTSRKVKTLKSYFLANRNLGVFKLTFTLVATQLGSGLILGTAQRAYDVGVWGILYTVGMSIGFIILGCGLASRMRSLNITTTAEIFETQYKSYTLKLFASALSILSLWGILIAQIIASKILFLSLGINDPYILLSFWSFLIFYTMIGGLESIVIIDTIQVIIILTIFSILFVKALPISLTKTISFKLINKAQGYYYSKKLILFDFLPTLLMPTLFSLIEQDLAQKFFAAKTRLTATISAFLAGYILIAFSCIPLFFGIFAKIKNITIPTGINPLIPVLTTVATDSMLLLAICAIMAAITATANSLLSAISSNIVQDFGSKLKMEHHKLWTSRIVSCIVGISALVASYIITGDIISVLENSYRISVICLFVPTVIAYFSKEVFAQAAWISLICAISGYIYISFYIPSTTQSTPPIILRDIIPLMCALIGYTVTHITMSLYKKPNNH